MNLVHFGSQISPNLSPRSAQIVKVVMTVTRHPQRAMSLRKKMRQTLMAEPEMTVKAQMVATLMRKVLGHDTEIAYYMMLATPIQVLSPYWMM